MEWVFMRWCSCDYISYLRSMKSYEKRSRNSQRCLLKIIPLQQIQLTHCKIRKIAGVHAPGMPGTFSPPPRVSDPDMHHCTCVTHVPWCMPGSLTSGFLWSQRQGENVPAIPDACATRNFTYLVKGAWNILESGPEVEQSQGGDSFHSKEYVNSILANRNSLSKKNTGKETSPEGAWMQMIVNHTYCIIDFVIIK